MSYPHAPGTLARKLRDEAPGYDPRVVRDGSGRPGMLRLANPDGTYSASFRADGRTGTEVLGRVRAGLVTDPDGLLFEPDSSD